MKLQSAGCCNKSYCQHGRCIKSSRRRKSTGIVHISRYGKWSSMREKPVSIHSKRYNGGWLSLLPAPIHTSSHPLCPLSSLSSPHWQHAVGDYSKASGITCSDLISNMDTVCCCLLYYISKEYFPASRDRPFVMSEYTVGIARHSIRRAV